jgi:hypothetical protein
MLDQLLQEMGAVRWQIRAPQILLQSYCALKYNGQVVAYLDVKVQTASDKDLLAKMLAAINLSNAGLVVGGLDYKLPLLHDNSDGNSDFVQSFILPTLSSVIDVSSKRAAWTVLQQLQAAVL